MSQADLYRGYAEACFQAAKATVDDRERARWLGMAQHWLQWAEGQEAGDVLSPMPARSPPEQPHTQQQQQPQPDAEKKE